MKLNEIVKDFLRKPDLSGDKDSSKVTPQNIIADLTSGDVYPNTGSFFDDTSLGGAFGSSEATDILFKQKDKIMKYRQLAMLPDITNALDEIINEIVFSFDDKLPLKIDINEENDALVKAITEKFTKVVGLLDTKRSLYSIVKNGYVDGQIILHTAYDKGSVKKGIKSIKMIEPSLLYFDKRDKTYRYMDENKSGGMRLGQHTNKEVYSIEEICREDFGLYDGKLNLGYLEYAMKPANMLKTLEDLLIPLRFSRSISRRVFNVDIGDLPSKRGAEIMRDYQGKFKYKKFYNTDDGTVTNQQHITSMVEDYWFANRSGGKGTTVDVLDETGNLGELGDILYLSKKLYTAMKIPSSRISINPDADSDFGYDESRTTKEDMKFFMFISRIRQVYSSLFKEVLKREVISTGVMKESEWEEKENLISISFANENKFIEKMKLDNFMSKLDIYSTAQEYEGKLFPVEYIMKEVFRFSDEEIKNNLESIQKEKKDSLYQDFYSSGDNEKSSW